MVLIVRNIREVNHYQSILHLTRVTKMSVFVSRVPNRKLLTLIASCLWITFEILSTITNETRLRSYERKYVYVQFIFKHLKNALVRKKPQ